VKRLALIKDSTKFWKIYELMFKEYSMDVITLDIFNYEDQQRLLNEEWDGVFWRAKHNPKYRDLAKRVISLFDNSEGVKVFPSRNDYWHYDDKISQNFIMQKNNINTPETHIFYMKSEALEYAKKAQYPIVYKYPHGAGSSNVGLLNNKLQAYYYILRAFNKGIKTYFREEIQRKYVYFQEFLSENNGDYRILCYKNDIIKGFFRENRKNSPFASGSGVIKEIELPDNLLNFISDTHQKIDATIMSYDLMKDKNGDWSLTEFSALHGDRTSTIYNEILNYTFKNNMWKAENNTVDWITHKVEFLLKNAWKW